MKNCRLLIIVCTLLLTTNCLFAQLETGLLVGGGIGSMSNVTLQTNNSKVNDFINSGGYYDASYKYNIELGYRFRYNLPKPMNSFLDLDILGGMKTICMKEGNDQTSSSYTLESNDVYFPVSLSITYNYMFYKNFFLGAGLEPTYYLDSPKKSFDLPIIAKVGYNLNNKIEFALSYKYGLLNSFKTDVYKSGHFSDWTIGIFIPFTTK